MRVTINGFDVEGTPEEVDALLRAQRVATPERKSTEANDLKEDIYEDERFASEAIAYRALRRRPLSAAQRILFKTLANAYPEWVSASRLQSATNYNPNQLGGLLGATGRRLSQTEGYVPDSSLIEWMWDADENEYTYRLPPTVLNAVRRIDP